MAKPRTIFPFNWVDVIAAPSGQLIEWAINPEFPLQSDDPVFYVEYAVAGGDWVRLNTVSIRNETSYVDTVQRRFNLNDDNSYRVIVADGESTGATEHASLPALVNGNWNWRDWALARDIVRKEYLALTRYTGTPGYLMKRRTVGISCPDCADFDLGPVASSQCTTCRGTGLINGYYDAVPFFMALSEQARSFDQTQDSGITSNAHTRIGRCVMYPRIEQFDVWVEAQTNIRYKVHAVQVVSALRGKSLIANAQLRVVSGADNVLQAIPQAEPADGSGNTPGGWTHDLSVVEW